MLPGDDLADLGQLVHEVDLGLQAAGRVHIEHVHSLLEGAVHGFEGHGGGIGARLLGVEERAHALGPHAHLVYGGSPEGVGRGYHDLPALHAVAVGKLGDGRRLARAVDADHEHDFRRVDLRDALRLGEDRLDLALQGFAHALGGGHALLAAALPEALDQAHGSLVAEVGHDEELLQLLPELVVKFAVAGEEPVETPGKLSPRLGEALRELHKEAAALVLFVLQIQSDGQAVLQLGAELVEFAVLHARKPAGKVGQEGVYLGSRRLEGLQEKADARLEQGTRLGNAVQDDVEPCREPGLGLAQAHGELGVGAGLRRPGLRLNRALRLALHRGCRRRLGARRDSRRLGKDWLLLRRRGSLEEGPAAKRGAGCVLCGEAFSGWRRACIGGRRRRSLLFRLRLGRPGRRFRRSCLCRRRRRRARRRRRFGARLGLAPAKAKETGQHGALGRSFGGRLRLRFQFRIRFRFRGRLGERRLRSFRRGCASLGRR